MQVGRLELLQRVQEAFATGTFGHLFRADPAGKLLGQGRRHDPPHGNWCCVTNSVIWPTRRRELSH